MRAVEMSCSAPFAADQGVRVEVQVKTFTCSYDEFAVLLGSLINSRDYFEKMLVSMAEHPDWFEISPSEITSRVSHLNALLKTLGVYQ